MARRWQGTLLPSDLKLMAVDVTPGPGLTFKPPHELFQEPHLDLAQMIETVGPAAKLHINPRRTAANF